MIIKKKIFVKSSYKTYVVGAHYNHRVEAILMSTHSIGFDEEMSKNEQNYPLIIINYYQALPLWSQTRNFLIRRHKTTILGHFSS